MTLRGCCEHNYSLYATRTFARSGAEWPGHYHPRHIGLAIPRVRVRTCWGCRRRSWPGSCDVKYHDMSRDQVAVMWDIMTWTASAAILLTLATTGQRINKLLLGKNIGLGRELLNIQIARGCNSDKSRENLHFNSFYRLEFTFEWEWWIHKHSDKSWGWYSRKLVREFAQ